MDLASVGWDEQFAAAFDALSLGADAEPARVAIEFNYLYRVWSSRGPLEATASGRLKHHAISRSQLPAVGDWVAVRRRANQEKGAIVAVLPRRSAFSRRMAGSVTDEQVVASNVDIVFVVMGLDADFSVRRLERYLLLARESGATPVIILTKPDLSDDSGARVAAVTSVAGVPVHVVNPRLRVGLEQVAAYLGSGCTGALLGSSGVGKSTIINGLAGENIRKTGAVRESDQTGRHTTSHRELIVLPNGGLIIDTPGMRELQLWDAGDAVRQTFDDIEDLARSCQFTDCRHRDEPRCAVKDAVADGRVQADRLAGYLKLQDELLALARQQDERALLERKRQSRIMGKAAKKFYKERRH